MPQFYARYVPPAHVKPHTSDQDDSKDRKRKSTSRASPKPKKRKIEDGANGTAIATTASDKQIVPDAESPSKNTKSFQFEQKIKVGSHAQEKLQNVPDSRYTNGKGEDEVNSTKHARVLEKFSKRKDQAARPLDHDTKSTNGVSEQHVHPDRTRLVNNLNPIPQPEIELPERPLPSYSTEPEWMKNPVRVSSTARLKFKELKLSNEIVQSLAEDRKHEALPVQAAVLPMILAKDVEGRSDICVAAATGSGKTLAYVLPIIRSLQGRQQIRLRAVIVVPTRALVKQVVQTLRACTAHLDLRVGTAEGSRSLAEEQKLLVEEEMIYDPTEYKKQQELPIDWDTFDPSTLLDEAGRNDPFATIGHVKAFFSKIDVLVCTPGRLVEHLQYTSGFNLDYVEWFVVDEADRLLNESYHEWLDTVLPSLRSQAAFSLRNEMLKKMHIPVLDRRVTKVLLSATMTSDLSQLMALQLSNPKLIIVEDQTTSGQDELRLNSRSENDNSEYQIPSRLIESAIAFKDSENKPLYLVELIQSHIWLKEHSSSKGNKRPVSVDRDVSGTETSDQDDSSSSGSDTDNDSTSDSSTSSGSDDESVASSTSSVTASSDSVSETSSSSTDSIMADSKVILPTEAQPASTNLRSDRLPRVLVFTKSTESAHRLARLLSILAPHLTSYIETFTRASSGPDGPNMKSNKSHSKTRTRILQSFTAGRTRVLISTDLAGRGLDIPNLEHVVNYDVPASALTYVHRVGRTARAGNEGHAWTLIEHKQGKWFWETIGGKVKQGEHTIIGRGGRHVQKVTIAPDMVKWAKPYEEALKQLGEDVRGQ